LGLDPDTADMSRKQLHGAAAQRWCCGRRLNTDPPAPVEK
jgi:hypothetical protein